MMPRSALFGNLPASHHSLKGAGAGGPSQNVYAQPQAGVRYYDTLVHQSAVDRVRELSRWPLQAAGFPPADDSHVLRKF